MASKASQKVYRVNDIKSGKKYLTLCPKFKEYMLLKGETAAAYRSHPVSFNLPEIILPNRLDRNVATYLRDNTVTSPKCFIKQADALRHAMWTRLILLEKNLQVYYDKKFEYERQRKYNILMNHEKFENITENDDLESMISNFAAEEMEMKKSAMNRESEMLMKEMTSPIVYSKHLSDLYLISRLASNYATCARVFFEIRKRCPRFKPMTMFDFGCGVGSAVWAANAVWDKTIQQHTMIDASPSFLEIAEYLLKDGNIKLSRNTAFPGIFMRGFLPALTDTKYDLVVSAFSLTDICGGYLNRREVLDNLWEKTNKFLVITELGNRSGFQAILEARDYLINNKEDAVLFAPCPHSFACPKSVATCNFTLKYQKLRLTELKTSTLIEKFSYLILYKGSDISNYQDETEEWLSNYPRNVTYNGGNNIQDMCMKDGSAHRFFIPTDKKVKRLTLKKSRPGDFIPFIQTQSMSDEDDEI